MGYDLRGPDSEFRFSTTAWPKALGLATMFGWVPHGTEPPMRRTLRPDLPQYYHDAGETWLAEMLKANFDGADPSTLQPPPYPDDAWIDEPRDLSWDGGYDSNDYQRVTDDDATNLAAALERALPELRDYNVTEIKARPVTGWIADLVGNAARDAGIPGDQLMTFGPAEDSDPIEYFSGDLKQKIVDFIAFCKTGGFTIA